MSQVSKLRRITAVALAGALIATAVPPVQAMPVPVSRELGASTAVEQVQYRRTPAPRRKVMRRGNRDAAAAAAIIGALAIGGAAIAASQSPRRSRTYYDDGYYYGQPSYVAPQGYYYDEPQYHYTQPRRRWQQAPQFDSGSPYAVQQQRYGQRYQPRAVPVDPYAPQRVGRRYVHPQTGQALPPGVLPPPTGPYQQGVPNSNDR